MPVIRDDSEALVATLRRDARPWLVELGYLASMLVVLGFTTLKIVRSGDVASPWISKPLVVLLAAAVVARVVISLRMLGFRQRLVFQITARGLELSSRSWRVDVPWSTIRSPVYDLRTGRLRMHSEPPGMLRFPWWYRWFEWSHGTPVADMGLTPELLGAAIRRFSTDYAERAS